MHTGFGFGGRSIALYINNENEEQFFRVACLPAGLTLVLHKTIIKQLLDEVFVISK